MARSSTNLSPRLTPHQGAGIASYPPGATFGPRRMLDHEFVWIIEGDAVYHRDDQSYIAPEGSIVLCRPGAIDRFTWDQRRRTRHGYFHFDLHEPPADWPAPAQWPVVALPVEGDVLVPLFQHVLTWSGRGDDATAAQTILLMLRLFATGQRDVRGVPADAAPDPVERAIAHVYATLDADPAAPLALDTLAEVACVTPEHLCRLFKKSLDLSPMECVRLARLDRAAVLLSRSNYSVGQIASMCGFASQFHFARRFKEAFGDTPSRIRLRVRQGAIPPLPRLMRRSRP